MEYQPLKDTEARRQLLLKQARETKPAPGVYLMKDDTGLVLYVGKAKNLKNRLLSYFQSPVHDVARTEMMVSRVSFFDVILTETESEALILEASLIKKHKPKFNIRLKDDKTYPYLKVRIQEAFPKIEWTRRVLRDGSRYFGPFPSAWSARQVMRLLNETFQLRDCSDNTFAHRSRPCILHQMGKCTAPCVGFINENLYKESIGEVVEVLEGKSEKLVAGLRKGMDDAAEEEDYEQAAFYRDQIRNLDLITQTQGVFEVGSHRNRDIIGLARSQHMAQGTVLRVRLGKLLSVQHYHLQNADSSISDSEILSQILSQHYLAIQKLQEISEQDPENTGPIEAPTSEVLLPLAPLDADWLEKTLGLSLHVSETGVDRQLLSVASSNAQFALEQAQQKARGHGISSLEEVQEKLQLGKLPQRIECYDISNIHGQDAVASRVVFLEGAPEKSLYRRYKIRTVQGANDFAMMKEVLGRRFSNQSEDLPDLVVVDGGKGQLSQAVTILEELSVQGVEVVGLAKARTESNYQSAEIFSSSERIFIPNRKNPVPLSPQSEAFKLLTHIRDEAHRFAVSFHRIVRSKRHLRSKES